MKDVLNAECLLIKVLNISIILFLETFLCIMIPPVKLYVVEFSFNF